MRNVIFDGISAYADQFAIDKNGEPAFLSLYGNSQSISAILAAAVAGRSLQVQTSGQPFEKLQIIENLPKPENYLLVQRPQHYESQVHIKSAAVSWGRAHGIYYDSLCVLRETKQDFIAIAKSEEEARNKLFRTLDSRPLPILNQWRDPLIEMLEEEGHINELQTYGCSAFRVYYDEEAILKIISFAIKTHSLPLA
jgi:hypothetical protein